MAAATSYNNISASVLANPLNYAPSRTHPLSLTNTQYVPSLVGNVLYAGLFGILHRILTAPWHPIRMVVSPALLGNSLPGSTSAQPLLRPHRHCSGRLSLFTLLLTFCSSAAQEPHSRFTHPQTHFRDLTFVG